MYHVTAVCMKRGKSAYRAATLFDAHGGKGILVRSWTSPTHGLGTSVWVDNKAKLEEQFKRVLGERSADQYEVDDSFQGDFTLEAMLITSRLVFLWPHREAQQRDRLYSALRLNEERRGEWPEKLRKDLALWGNAPMDAKPIERPPFRPAPKPVEVSMQELSASIEGFGDWA